MKLTNSHRLKHQSKGMTLLELTVVVLVLLSLVSILFIGASAWKKGADRSQCLIISTTVQKAVRAYQNLHQLSDGAPLVHTGTIIGPGCLLESEPTCPEYGVYQWQTTIPAVGVAYIDCHDPNNSSDYHYPQNIATW